MDQDHDDAHDRGLGFDLLTMGLRRQSVATPPAQLDRRGALRLLGGFGIVALAAACGSDGSVASTGATSGTTATTAGGAATAAGGTCATIPQETAGPFPGDGSNGPNVLSESGVVRSDITSSFGSSTTKAKGIPLTVVLTIQEHAAGCAAYEGAAVYLWHCDMEGRYSLYDQAITGENYLRGVQEAGSDGTVTFKSIYPAAYSGRWPHIHFEVFESLTKATSTGSKLRTSQLALPEEASKLVYATSGYERSVSNLARTSLARDMVFSDGSAQQTPSVSGDVASGFTVRLDVPV